MNLKLLKWMSLRTRITIGTLVIIVLALWFALLIAGHQLRVEMEKAISAQQSSAVALAAKKVDQLLKERIAAIEELGDYLTKSKQPLNQQSFLDELMIVPRMFNWGIILLDSSGVVQASIPSRLHRSGSNYYDLPDVQSALNSGQVTVSDPLLDSVTQQPQILIMAPIRGEKRVVRGLAVGVINLAIPNIFDTVNAAKFGSTGDFFVMAPKSRTYVASSDKRRVMTHGPPKGVNQLYDQHMAGHEISGLAKSSRGVVELASAKRIQSVGWIMASVLPAKEAFAPVDSMHRTLLIGTVVLTVLASLITWWWLNLQFGPASEASNMLARMGDGSLPRQPLPIYRNDEIGHLSNAFNNLLNRIEEEEERAAEYAANELLSKIVSHVPGVVFQYRLFPDGHGEFIYVSSGFREIFGVGLEEVSENTEVVRSMIHPDDKDRFFESLRISAETLELWRVDHRLCHPDGTTKWLLVEAMPELVDEKLIWYGFISDITDVKKTEDELRIAATTFQAHEAFLITDADHMILRVNSAFTNITGFTTNDVIGLTPEILKFDIDIYREITSALAADGSWQGEVDLQRKSGIGFTAWLAATCVKDDSGATTHYVAMFQDISDRKEAEEKIRSLAFYDPLTNLPNRRLLLDRIQQAIANTSRTGQYGALLFIDIDNFKLLNDSRGHDIGDQLLVEVAKRLQSCVREGDSVARLGGDEFVLMVQDIDETEAAEQVEVITRKLLDILGQPCWLDGREYHGSSSIGVALFRGHDIGVDELVRRADLAMYQAKSTGRNAVRFFDPSMQAKIDHRSMMEGELRRALSENEFVLHYQPQIDQEKNCIGVEALIRWQHPVKGLVPPNEFVPVAEECDLIQPIGQWVIEQACSCLAEWRENEETAGLTVSVNISARQFSQDDFIDEVSKVVSRFSIEPNRLKFELTESMLLVDVNETIAKMLSLRGLGIGFSLDDFGTGYSSLSYLKRLPLDQLKIDRSFVDEIITDPNDTAICRAVIALGKSLGLQVIAEGVETEEHWSWLCEEDCDAVQGYYFSRPICEKDLLIWVQKHLQKVNS
jgi:diguanylate cyclase (GGDEF)-like protein/PAS domain S-box-containing protein